MPIFEFELNTLRNRCTQQVRTQQTPNCNCDRANSCITAKQTPTRAAFARRAIVPVLCSGGRKGSCIQLPVEMAAGWISIMLGCAFGCVIAADWVLCEPKIVSGFA